MKKKKSLGQHFLTNQGVLQKIINAAGIRHGKTVLEVGPGEGILTEALLEKGAKVFAVEKDDRLIPFLKEKFAAEISSGTLRLIHADILTIDPSDYTLQAISYKLVANLPYYITGTFLRKFLESDESPESMVLLLQREVAERIVARDGKESILSISVKAYGAPRIVAKVGRGSFTPPPAVDSAILTIEKISKEFFRAMPEKMFFETLRRGFSKKRKILWGNLGIPNRARAEIARRCGVALNARAEDLPLPAWRRLAEEITKSRPFR